MSLELEVYVATSGPYRMAFAADQIESTRPCPAFAVAEGDQPGVLGTRDGLLVVHPGWFWGDAEVKQQPKYLLVVRSSMCALAVDTCQLQRLRIDPAPSVLADNGMVFGLAHASGGLMPVFDLAYVPLA
jgi:hypothetical protein